MKFIFDFLEAAIEARGQKWTKNFVGGNNIVKIFLQTDFQKDWAKDKEMTGIFHLFSFVLRKHETRPLCKIGYRVFELHAVLINSVQSITYDFED